MLSPIKAARLALGVDQRALARRVKTSNSYISRIEQGHVAVTVAMAARISKALGIEKRGLTVRVEVTRDAG